MDGPEEPRAEDRSLTPTSSSLGPSPSTSLHVHVHASEIDFDLDLDDEDDGEDDSAAADPSPMLQMPPLPFAGLLGDELGSVELQPLPQSACIAMGGPEEPRAKDRSPTPTSSPLGHSPATTSLHVPSEVPSDLEEDHLNAGSEADADLDDPAAADPSPLLRMLPLLVTVLGGDETFQCSAMDGPEEPRAKDHYPTPASSQLGLSPATSLHVPLEVQPDLEETVQPAGPFAEPGRTLAGGQPDTAQVCSLSVTTDRDDNSSSSGESDPTYDPIHNDTDTAMLLANPTFFDRYPCKGYFCFFGYGPRGLRQRCVMCGSLWNRRRFRPSPW